MKKLVLAITLISILAVLFSTFYNRAEAESAGVLGGASAESSASSPEAPSPFGQISYEIYKNPVRLFSRENSLDLPLIEVGVEPDGALEAPKDWWVGGWYHDSSRPGEAGNTIINAHYDDNLGRPAAFFGLKNLSVNDTLTLADELGREFEYRVVEKYYVSMSDPERLKVFESKEDVSEVTLITCSGVWTPSSGYNKRLIVKAILQ